MNLKVFNKNDPNIPSGAIYIGRPSEFGNPFEIGKDGTRTQVIEKYKQYVYSNDELIAKIKSELKGKCLVCWCSPLACHGDTLLEIANEITLDEFLEDK